MVNFHCAFPAANVQNGSNVVLLSSGVHSRGKLSSWIGGAFVHCFLMPFSFGQVVYEGRSLYWGTRGHWDDLSTEDKCSEEAGAQALLRFLDEQSKTHPALFKEKAAP